MRRNNSVSIMLPRVGRVNSFWFKTLAILLIVSWVYVYQMSSKKCPSTQTLLFNQLEMRPLRNYNSSLKTAGEEQAEKNIRKKFNLVKVEKQKFHEPASLQTDSLEIDKRRLSSVHIPSQTKTILAYTNIYGNMFDINKYGRTNGEIVKEPNPFAGCQYSCNWTTDHSHVNSADALLFHLYNNLQNKDFIVDQLPKRVNAKQKWIFMAREPQAFYYPEQLKQLDDMFNLTVTFQRDSDVWIPYGSYWEYPEKSKKYYLSRDISYYDESGKKRMVAWIASNCVTSSRRENFVKELQQYIQVDIYGKCGNLTTESNSANGFRQQIANQYHFYLAFENSDCDDYISEKFWNSLDIGIIPVVRGSKVDYKALAPPNSYIQAETFMTPQKLAAFLKQVASNKSLYNSFHEWRKLYFAKYKFFTTNSDWMCELCEKVHTSNPRTWKISEHFGEDRRCFTYQTVRNRTGEHVEDIFRH